MKVLLTSLTISWALLAFSHTVEKRQIPFGLGGGGVGPQSLLGINVNVANQKTTAIGGAGSTVVASGTATAQSANQGQGQGVPGGYGQGVPGGYGLGGLGNFQGLGNLGFGHPGLGGGGINSANQRTNAIGGAGSTVVASGTANAGGSGALNQNGGFNQNGGLNQNALGLLGLGNLNGLGLGHLGGRINSANQQTTAIGGDGSTVIADGTATANRRSKRLVVQNLSTSGSTNIDTGTGSDGPVVHIVHV